METKNLRERTRGAVAREIALAAVELFVTRGYEATTINDIAAAVGMSQRSVFRYFPTKEDIIVGKLELNSGAILDGLRARPAGEPEWVSLRRLFDVMDVPDRNMRPIQRIVLETPALHAVYLQKLQGLQRAAATVLVERAAAAGRPHAAADLAADALAAAAFGCFVVAQYAWLAAPDDAPIAVYLDRAMAVIAPIAQ
ncbi:TetR/AcrR family transcriptional regulator [Catenuloplanes japonicus]|uniref:TetR/AcrR family transcriptional regulator n=1 Tax=Catenuloplanes japonicus TaxID=33876 RepID=UPI000691105D|nr:TetR/AcrR family transcriptional regulator [Catenuloplanes japonicus]